MARDASPLGQFVLSKNPSYQSPKGTIIEPTTGTQAQEPIVCSNLLEALQILAGMARAQHDELLREIEAFRVAAILTKAVTPKLYNFQEKRLKAIENASYLIMNEMNELCDASKPNKIAANIMARSFVDGGLATPNYINFCFKVDKIAKKAGEIKLDAKKNKEEIILDTSSIGDKVILDDIPMYRIKYCLEIYIILPGGIKINMDSYIKELMYTRLYDNTSLPIYSILFSLPYTILTQIKSHNEKIKWFMTINTLNKNGKEATVFELPVNVLENVEFIPVDPIYNTAVDHLESNSDTMPIHPFKIDLVPANDTKLNANVESKVLSNCRLIDVLMSLANDLEKQYKTLEVSADKELKVSISPPDNVKEYEQVLIEPGSFTKTLYSLQEKYGIYNTGIRVSFSDLKVPKADGKGSKTVLLCAISGKGDSVPGEDSIKNVVIDLIEPRLVDSELQITEPFYKSGQYVDKGTGTMVLRSYLPYEVTRNNSKALINGHAIRVMNSSSIDHYISHCDSVDSDVGMSKIYWAKYDNPFALTQLQDSIREGDIEVTCQLNDINILALSNNLTYRLKFYGKDDKVYSGDYRLTRVAWWYRMGSSVKAINDIEISAALTFVNIPTLKVNGTEISRLTYGEKLEASKNAYSNNDGNLASFDGGKSPSGVTVNDKGARKQHDGPPFKASFVGRKDFYNKVIPAEIPDEWEMSPNVKFKHVYDTHRGARAKNAIGTALAKNYEYFINAQRFASEVVEPCISAGGKIGTNDKAELWFALQGKNAHSVALAISSTFGKEGETDLCTLFKTLYENSALNYDVIRLVSESGKWKYIYISKNMNGTNRNLIHVHYKGSNKRINKTKVKSPDDLKLDKVIKVCY